MRMVLLFCDVSRWELLPGCCCFYPTGFPMSRCWSALEHPVSTFSCPRYVLGGSAAFITSPVELWPQMLFTIISGSRQDAWPSLGSQPVFSSPISGFHLFYISLSAYYLGLEQECSALPKVSSYAGWKTGNSWSTFSSPLWRLVY